MGETHKRPTDPLGSVLAGRPTQGNSTWSTFPLVLPLTPRPHFSFLGGELRQNSRGAQSAASESDCLVQTLVPRLGKSLGHSEPCFCICKMGMLTAPIARAGRREGSLRWTVR